MNKATLNRDYYSLSQELFKLYKVKPTEKYISIIESYVQSDINSSEVIDVLIIPEVLGGNYNNINIRKITAKHYLKLLRQLRSGNYILGMSLHQWNLLIHYCNNFKHEYDLHPWDKGKILDAEEYKQVKQEKLEHKASQKKKKKKAPKKKVEHIDYIESPNVQVNGSKIRLIKHN